MCFCTANRSATLRLSRSFRIRERQRAVPGLVGDIQLVQRMDQRVAAGERHSNQVGLVFHLARQRALRQHDETEHVSISERIDQTISDSTQPTQAMRRSKRDRPRRNASSRRAAQSVAGDLLRDVDPAADGHRALREVAELVRQHRLATRRASAALTRPRPISRFLRDGNSRFSRRQVVEHRRVDARRQEHAMRRAARRAHRPAGCRTQTGAAVLRRDFDVVDRSRA